MNFFLRRSPNESSAKDFSSYFTGLREEEGPVAGGHDYFLEHGTNDRASNKQWLKSLQPTLKTYVDNDLTEGLTDSQACTAAYNTAVSKNMQVGSLMIAVQHRLGGDVDSAAHICSEYANAAKAYYKREETLQDIFTSSGQGTVEDFDKYKVKLQQDAAGKFKRSRR